MKPLIHHLLGETRTAILAALLLHPDKPRHVRELVRATGASPGTLHRELNTLVDYGVLQREQIGRQVFYRADVTCSVLDEENGAQVAHFLARHPEFSLRPPADLAEPLGERAFLFRKAVLVSDHGLLMTPRRTDTDGFFVAGLQRTA